MHLVLLELCNLSRQKLFVQVNVNDLAVLNNLTQLLRIQLLLNHDFDHRVYDLCDDLLSCLRHAQVISNRLLS